MSPKMCQNSDGVTSNYKSNIAQTKTRYLHVILAMFHMDEAHWEEQKDRTTADHAEESGPAADNPRPPMTPL